MVDIVVTTRDGASHSLEARVGATLMQVIRDQDLDEAMGLCGGSISCASCHVLVDPAFFDGLPPASASEIALLDSLEQRAETSRLSCQMKCDDGFQGLRVTIAPEE